jgi:hypothetical protein
MMNTLLLTLYTLTFALSGFTLGTLVAYAFGG